MGNLSRTIWEEPGELWRERKCRVLLSTPFAIVAGVAYGFFLNSSTGSGVVSGTIWGSVAFILFFYVEHLLSPWLDAALVRIAGEGSAGLGEFVFDASAGALVAWFVVDLIGVPTFAGLTSATALGAMYALVMGALFCGKGFDNAFSLALGGPRSSKPRRSDYSQVDAMVKRGEFEAAATLYREAMAQDPLDPVPAIRLARLFAKHLDDPGEAIRVLSEARRKARLTPEEGVFFSRELVDLWRFGMGQPQKAAPELAKLAEHFGDTEAGRWAREELRALREELHGPNSHSSD